MTPGRFSHGPGTHSRTAGSVGGPVPHGVRHRDAVGMDVMLFREGAALPEGGIMKTSVADPVPFQPTMQPDPRKEGSAMKWEKVSADWARFRGMVRSKWSFLTEEDLDAIAGNREMLAGRLELRYGITKNRAGEWVDGFLRELDKAA